MRRALEALEGMVLNPESNPLLREIRGALGQRPAAWRVRGYSQFKTGEPGPWRYIDGAERPKVNNPECCDFEPLYL